MADLGCPPNAALAFDFLVSKGLRDYQAAGIVGNLQQESRLNPRAVSPPDPVEPSRGIAQWQPPGWNALLAFASSTGRDPWSLDLQLNFLWHQLESQPELGLGPLSVSATLEDATVIFQNRFERPNAQLAGTSSRIAYARSTLYACPTINPPLGPPRRGGVVAAAAGVVALVAAAGYGVYKAMSARAPEPEPEPRPRPRPEPVFPSPPSFRPAPIRPPWRP
jgi:hypothetical protein